MCYKQLRVRLHCHTVFSSLKKKYLHFCCNQYCSANYREQQLPSLHFKRIPPHSSVHPHIKSGQLSSHLVSLWARSLLCKLSPATDETQSGSQAAGRPCSARESHETCNRYSHLHVQNKLVSHSNISLGCCFLSGSAHKTGLESCPTDNKMFMLQANRFLWYRDLPIDSNPKHLLLTPNQTIHGCEHCWRVRNQWEVEKSSDSRRMLWRETLKLEMLVHDPLIGAFQHPLFPHCA